MGNLEDESYSLERPSYYYSLDDALKVCELRPQVTFQIKKVLDSDDWRGWDVAYNFCLWTVVLLSSRCPSCGRYRGTTDPGMPDPKKQGGAEHICWKCTEMFKDLLIQQAKLKEVCYEPRDEPRSEPDALAARWRSGFRPPSSGEGVNSKTDSQSFLLALSGRSEND
jgi:hypothetical protein